MIKKKTNKPTKNPAFAIFVLQKFLKLLAGLHEVPVGQQVPKSTVRVIGVINSSANGIILKYVFWGILGYFPPHPGVSAPPGSSHSLSPVPAMPGITPITKSHIFQGGI